MLSGPTRSGTPLFCFGKIRPERGHLVWRIKSRQDVLSIFKQRAHIVECNSHSSSSVHWVSPNSASPWVAVTCCMSINRWRRNDHGHDEHRPQWALRCRGNWDANKTSQSSKTVNWLSGSCCKTPDKVWKSETKWSRPQGHKERRRPSATSVPRNVCLLQLF